MRGLEIVALTIGAVAACGGPPEPRDPPAASAGSGSAARDPVGHEAAPPASVEEDDAGVARKPITVVTDPATLATVEAHGGALGSFFGRGPEATTLDLAGRPEYRAVVQTLETDLSQIAREDRRAGVGIRGHAHRLFDARWLRSATHRFSLVAVVNRLDRRPFHDEACGETRLVYRLGYEAARGGRTLKSRLPMTLIAELDAPPPVDGSCRDAARRWLVPEGMHGAELGRWLLSDAGPLHAPLRDRSRLAQLAVNVQAVRWPSTVRPDMAGHAEYILRAYRWDPDASTYREKALENTPDVARLARDHALARDLLAWLRDEANRRRLAGGTATLPERFVATKVVSVTPHGLARRANRPFRQLYRPSDFADLDLTGLPYGRSPEAYLRRLDDLTCNGCHQSRSVAGFHVLGEDGPDAAVGNALAVPVSPHLTAERRRRRTVTERLARGEPVDYARPFAERADPDDGGYGARCGLGDPGFSAWRCDEGLRCQPIGVAQGEARTVGVCVPRAPETGDPCEVGEVRPYRDPRRDRVVARADLPCGAGAVCNTNRVGFPGGMCTPGCGAASHTACGAIAVLTPFNLCVARGEPFDRCVAEHSAPAGLRRCSEEAPCRDDYLCANTPDGGGCIPPYFLFQLRVDGHGS